MAKVDLFVYATRADKGSIKLLGVVGGHDDDAPGGVHDSVQDVQQALHLSTCYVLERQNDTHKHTQKNTKKRSAFDDELRLKRAFSMGQNGRLYEYLRKCVLQECLPKRG